MIKKLFPLFLLLVVLVNNGIGFLNVDTERGETLKSLSTSLSKKELEMQLEENKSKKISEKMDYSSIEIPSIEAVKQAPEVDKQKIGGTLSIPTIDLNLNILVGTNSVNMLYGATTGLVGQEMGKGNYVLFGHNMEQSGVLFSDLNQLKKGDKMTLTGEKNQTFTYEVSSTFIVDKTAVEVLETSKEPVLTLITCSTVDKQGKKVFAGSTPYRLVVVGTLK